MLRENQRIETLSLESLIFENTTNTIPIVMQGARGHGSWKKFSIVGRGEAFDENVMASIANLLTTPSALRKLRLIGYDVGDVGAHHLAMGLSNENCVLSKIELSGCSLGDASISSVATWLQQNTSLEEIDLSNNDIGDGGAQALANLLSQNQTIRRLSLGINNIGEDETGAIADALPGNTSLQVLHLSWNPTSDDGVIRMMYALQTNCTLKTLCLGVCGEKAMASLIRGMPHLTGLKRLSILGCTPEFNSEVANAFLKAFERNMWLNDFSLGGNFAVPGFRAQVHRLMELNKAGRKILGSHDVPNSLWPHVLAKSSDKPDVINYFLQEKPDLFKKQTLLGKRKRGSSSCTIS